MKVNFNENQDDHVSFTALDVSVSPDGKYLLVSTDKSRLIVYPIGGSSQVSRRFENPLTASFETSMGPSMTN